MNVEELMLSRFLEGSDKNFIIPVYQRNYSWKKSDCDKLWLDIIDLIEHVDKTHFLGTLVTVNAGRDKYLVIDGQQRLTTLTLLLLAIRQFLKKLDHLKPDEEKLIEQIEDYLINKYETDDNSKIKLKPNMQDKENFTKLFNAFDINNDSNITNNFSFFLDMVGKNKDKIIDIFKAFKRLRIVSILLDPSKDDAQLIFESLNSTGVALKESDLIRNYILMNLGEKDQNIYYNNYWKKIEENVSDVSEFFRVYLMYKTATNVRSFEVYSFFKKFTNGISLNKKDLLEDILINSVNYSIIENISEHQNKEITNLFKQIKELAFTVANLYFMDILDEFKKDSTGDKIIIDVINTVLAHAFRKILVDEYTASFNKFYLTLAKEIKKNTTYKSEYINILNYILLNRQNATRFCTDVELQSTLFIKDLYNIKAKNRNFLFQKIENYDNPYKLDITTIQDLTLEHIMPQKLRDEQKLFLGDNHKDIHKKYLHTLGNLTLTLKNSELSNNNFDDKKDIDFDYSRLKLSNTLSIDTKFWGPEQIENRTREFTDIIIKIWPYPTSTFVTDKKEIERYTLESDILLGSKPKKIFIFENEYQVSSWKTLFIKILDCLKEYSPIDFIDAVKKETNLTKNTLDYTDGKYDISENLYIVTNRSSSSIISTLANIVNSMGLDNEKIEYELK